MGKVIEAAKRFKRKPDAPINYEREREVMEAYRNKLKEEESKHAHLNMEYFNWLKKKISE